MRVTGSGRTDTDPSMMLNNQDSLLGEIGMNRKASDKARRAGLVRAASKRRRFVDPATCERDYSRAELEFMNAIQAFKLKSGRTFPTWAEVLVVLRDLGYEKVASPSTAS